jgi:hypothetical protein
MTKRLSIVVPILAAGALLLSACGTGTTSASDSTSDTPTPTTSTTTSTSDTSDTSTPAPGTGEELAPVDCGAVTLDTRVTHQLIADPAATGIVGCTEAFDVVDEFTRLPAEQRSAASLGGVDLPSGWSCTVDDGETANLGCVKDKVGDKYGFALHTEQRS